MKIKISKKATSIVEAMIVMLVIVSGVTGMYKIYNESVKLLNSTTDKIQAIQIATQGIEGFTNIRDTNWVLFSSDYENCWNTLNFDSGCIGGVLPVSIANASYRIYTDSSNRWTLEEKASLSSDFTDSTYQDNFKMYYDSNGIYSQTGTVADQVMPLFTRELKVEYLPNGLTTDKKLRLTSIVQWGNSSSTAPHKIEMEQILTNWKK